MKKIHYLQLCSLLLFVIALNSFAANKIVLVGGNEATKAGLLDGLGEGLTVPLNDPELPPSATKPLLSFDPAVNRYDLSYDISGQTVSYVIEFEDDAEQLVALSQDPEVVTILCTTSTVCGKALVTEAAKNVLIISLTATASELAQSENILRFAPSNALQATLLHDIMSYYFTPEQRYAVVYEPTLYGLDLYKNFISAHIHERLYGEAMPQFTFALPLHTYVTLQTAQKSIDASTILQTLRNANLDAVIYFGYIDGFRALADNNHGGQHDVTGYWFAGDGVQQALDLEVEKFTNASVVGLFYAQNSNSDSPAYYYAYDAGQFLRVLQAQFPQESTDRLACLEKAKAMVLPNSQTKTGTKSFTSADEESLFFLHYLENGQKRTDIITVTAN